MPVQLRARAESKWPMTSYPASRSTRFPIAAALCLALLAVAPARGIVSCAKGKFGQEKYLQLTVYSEMNLNSNRLANPYGTWADNDANKDNHGQAIFCARVDTETTNTDTAMCTHPTGYDGEPRGWGNGKTLEVMTFGTACPFTGTPRAVPYRRSGGENRGNDDNWQVRSRKTWRRALTPHVYGAWCAARPACEVCS